MAVGLYLLPKGFVPSRARLMSAQVSTVKLRMSSTMNTEMFHFPAEQSQSVLAKAAASEAPQQTVSVKGVR